MNKRIDKEKRKQEKRVKKQDFTVLDLPHNRFQVFFDLIKTRYEIFLMISGMLFMFLIPFVVKNLSKDILIFIVFGSISPIVRP